MKSTYAHEERVPQERAKAYKRGGGLQIDEIERTYFLNGP